MVIVFTIGIFVGCIVTRLLIDMTSGHGEFVITPYDEDNTGFYTVNVRVDTNDDLLKKGYMLGPMAKLNVTGSQALNVLSDDKRWRAKFIKKVAETFAD